MGGKSYKCRDCRKAFVYQSSLKKHMEIHTGEKPYACENCGKTFRYILHLNKHMRNHNLKTFECPECGKSLNKSSKLKEHVRIHTGEKPYKCQECGKTFNKSSKLKEHTRIHTGEKSYKCKECGESYTNSSSLKTHLKRVCGWKEWGEAFIHFRKVLSAEGGRGGRELSEWTKMETSSLNSQILQKCKISHFSFFKGNMGKPSVFPKCTVLVKTHWRTSLAVQWVSHHPPTAEVWSLVGQLRSHMPCSRAKKVKNKTHTAKASYEIKECGHTLHTHPSLYT